MIEYVQRSDNVVREKVRGNLIVISGPSGCGKGTVCEALLKKNPKLFLNVSMTTREPRDGEVDGVDYYFVSKDEFLNKIDDGGMLEYAVVYNGNYYGTPKEEVEKKLNEGVDVVLEIEIEGAAKVNEAMPEGILIFIMPPSMRELKRRLIKRNTETKEQIVERFKRAYREINEVNKYNYIVINDEVDRAVNKIDAIIKAEKCRVNRIEDFDLNTKEEMIHELLTVDLKDYKK